MPIAHFVAGSTAWATCQIVTEWSPLLRGDDCFRLCSLLVFPVNGDNYRLPGFDVLWVDRVWLQFRIRILRVFNSSDGSWFSIDTNALLKVLFLLPHVGPHCLDLLRGGVIAGKNPHRLLFLPSLKLEAQSGGCVGLRGLLLHLNY